MTKIERPRGARFEGIAAEPDLVHMERRTPLDEMVQMRPGKAREFVRMGLEPVEKLAVADQGNLHGFGHAAPLRARRQYVNEGTVVDDRPRRCKGADEIFQPELIDGILDADATVILGQHRGRKTNVADATVEDCGGIADRIQYCAATDRNRKGVPVDRVPREQFEQAGDGRRIVLADFTACNRHQGGDQFHASRVRRGIVLDLRWEVGEGRQNALVDKRQASMALVRFSPRERTNQAAIAEREGISREHHRIFVGDTERLQPNILDPLRGRIKHGILPSPAPLLFCSARAGEYLRNGRR